jgi:signal transduction histidine kinase
MEGTVPGEAVLSGQSERLSDVGARVRLGLGRLVQDAATALLVPLVFKGRSLGVLVAVDRLARGPEFGPEDERLLRGFTAAAATAVATAQSVESDRLRKSIESAEHERTRWARELHDETLQGLGALRIMVESGMKDEDPARALEVSRRVAAGLEDEIARLQALISELRPAALDDIGLEPALESLVQRAERTHGFATSLSRDLDSRRGRLAPELESTSYRLVQEALTNAGKHAGAKHVDVVRDDGRGFDPQADAEGFGLVGMRERVELVGGALTIESTRGQGTVISAQLPSRRGGGAAAAQARSA